MAASVGNAVGFAGGYYKWKEGRRMQKAAQRAIDGFEWQELDNPYNNLAPSTLGAEFRGEQMDAATATALDAARGGGVRGLAMGIGRVMQANVQSSREVAANLDEQQKAIDFAAAGQDVNNQLMMERRQAEELQGYGQQLNVGMNMKYGGVADMMNAAQAQGQTNQSIMSSVGSMFGGGMGGGMMGGGGGSSQQSPITASYGGGLPTNGGYNDRAAVYANNFGTSMG